MCSSPCTNHDLRESTPSADPGVDGCLPARRRILAKTGPVDGVKKSEKQGTYYITSQLPMRLKSFTWADFFYLSAAGSHSARSLQTVLTERSGLSPVGKG